MIGYLQGSVQENKDGRMLVTIGDDRGAVGYAVTVPTSPAYALISVGRPISLFIYTHVREDALDLFGFATKTEKDLFLALLSISGIGPKAAFGILSGGEPAEIFQAILTKDKDFLTRIPGVGKKTAERVVLELSDGLRKKVDSGALVLPTPKASPGAAARAALGDSTALHGEPSAIRDAKAALMGLGFREQDISALLAKLVAAEEGEELLPHRAEDLVKTALRHLS